MDIDINSTTFYGSMGLLSTDYVVYKFTNFTKFANFCFYKEHLDEHLASKCA